METAENLFFFDQEALRERGAELARAHAEADPFPHSVIDDFLPAEVADRVLAEFPSMERDDWQRFDEPRQKKLATGRGSELGAYTRHVLDQFNSAAFLEFLSALTGIDGLVPDPHFEGGGLHQIEPGGLLKVHVDFNRHSRTGLYRRINALLYLNKDWSDDYAGHLELWDRDMERRGQKVAPLFNRLVVFNTTDSSWHGHPEPLACPQGRSRKSLALYYYTLAPAEGRVGADHSTVFRRRPGEKTPITIREIGEQLCPPLILNTFERLSRRRG
jgi:Rps23 Pro-64 3,4-dihydroxylase Tpa1-like proline 4-hydroxylase